MRETYVDLQSQGNYTLFRETMALPVQNINHSAFRSMFEKEKLSGNNFNDWFARLKLVLRVEKKMHVIEQPLPPAPEAGAEPNIVAQWTALYDAHTEIACLMLGSMTPELHRQFELHYPYDMVQELRSMFEKQAGVEKFDLIQSFHECKLEEGISQYGLTLMALLKRFCGICKEITICITWGRQIGEIHVVGIGKGVSCDILELQMKRSKLALPSYLGIERKLKQGALYLYVGNGVRATVEALELTPPYTPQHNGVSERRNRTLLDMVRSMMNLTTLPLSFWDYALEYANTLLIMVWGCEALVKRDTPDKLEQRSVKCIFIGYPKETMGYYFYFPPENKIVVARSEEIQEEEDPTPSEITATSSRGVRVLSTNRGSDLFVGSTMYAVRCTRPDVVFAQNMTSRFQQNPGEPHWTAVKNILKYLRNTKDMFLVYGGNPSIELRVECYCDAGFETDRDDTKSQT
ncbi:retrotransposon protein, putative, ty1-copia subclass [Tanacetum coccineum]